jgi:hypothetical protein
MQPSNTPIVGGSEEQNKGLFDQVVSDSDKQELTLYSLLPENNSLTQENLLQSISSISKQVANLLGIESLDQQTFTSSGNWVKPKTGTIAIVEIYGAGGSGANVVNNANPQKFASGGAAGAYVFGVVPFSLLHTTETVTVGLGGASVVISGGNATSNGVNGGDSSFGAWFTATGGQGGTFSIAGLGAGTVATGGSVTVSVFFTFQSESGGSAIITTNQARTFAPTAGGWARYNGGTATIGAPGVSSYGNTGGVAISKIENTGLSSDFSASSGSSYGAGGGGIIYHVDIGGFGKYTSGSGGSGLVKISVF